MPEDVAYPLNWPVGYPRTDARDRSYWPSHRSLTFASARDNLIEELERSGYELVALSCNIRRRKGDGLPYANHSVPDDPGLAIYFRDDAGEGEASYVMPCDSWKSLAGNLQAIAITMRDLRRIGKRGVPDFQQRAYSGFKALPGEGKTGGASWWEVLGVERAASMEEIDRAFRREAKQAHPDRGGSRSAWDALQQAYEQAKSARG